MHPGLKQADGPRTLRLLMALLALLVGLAPINSQAQRVALLIGNADYEIGRLRNPPNDVRAMESALREVGFKVQTVLNANQNQMKRAVRDFGELAQGAEVAFLYYSGHGVQALGENYLIPLQATIRKESDYDVEAVSANAVMRQIVGARPRAAIVVLDACRDNPLAAVTKSTSKGLGRMDAPTGSMVAFATAPNTTASDEGFYARVLAQQIRTQGLELYDVFRNTTAEVQRLSGGRQVPRVSEVSITDRIFLAGTAAPPPPPPRQLVPGDVLKDCSDCPELVVLPTGSFSMGSPAAEAGRDEDEGPVREVRIGYRLAVGKYEVSRGEFGRFVQATGYKTEAERGDGCFAWNGKEWKKDAQRHWRSPGFEQGESHPVVCMSWNDVQEYLKWLNGQLPGKGYRLLSEAEWEYAARAGQGARRYPWGDDGDNREQCAYANGMDATGKAQVPGVTWALANCRDGHAYTAAGAALKPNAFGLHHMHGNAWEWVQDVWHDNFSGAPMDGSVWTAGGDSARRVVRGGSWNSYPRFLRSADRGKGAPGGRDDDTGFRIARTL